MTAPAHDYGKCNPEWATPTVRAMAKVVYGPSDSNLLGGDCGRFDLAPVLADALEEAGCDDRKFLAILRGNAFAVGRETVAQWIYTSYPGGVVYKLAYGRFSDFDIQIWAEWSAKYC